MMCPFINVEDRRKSHKAYRNRKKAFVEEYLRSHPCVNCGESDPVVLDFDHLDPSRKVAGISRMVCGGHMGLRKIIQEIEKCQVLCANCHRRKTHEERRQNGK